MLYIIRFFPEMTIKSRPVRQKPLKHDSQIAAQCFDVLLTDRSGLNRHFWEEPDNVKHSYL